MNAMLAAVHEFCGVYKGQGINHEGQNFTGQLELKPLLEGHGLRLRYLATAQDGQVLHSEESTIAPSVQGNLTLWNLNSNAPGLIPHEMRGAHKKPGALISFVFGYNHPEDTNTFREEITLDIWENSSLTYTYAWGLPSGDFQERSSVRLMKEK